MWLDGQPYDSLKSYSGYPYRDKWKFTKGEISKPEPLRKPLKNFCGGKTYWNFSSYNAKQVPSVNCKDTCQNNQDCDAYLINPNNKQCFNYTFKSNNKSTYNCKSFNNGRFYGEIRSDKSNTARKKLIPIIRNWETF